MLRKHQGIHQTGGKAGKLKKGYKYSGKKLKNGLPQILKVKKTKTTKQSAGTKKTKTTKQSAGTKKTKTTKQSAGAKKTKKTKQSAGAKKTKQSGGVVAEFTITTHNIGPRNHRFDYYNHVETGNILPPGGISSGERLTYNEFTQSGIAPPKTYRAFHKTDNTKFWDNRCQGKLVLQRNLKNYLSRTKPRDVFLLQEVQEGWPRIPHTGTIHIKHPDKTEVIYRYCYNRTGHAHYVMFEGWNDLGKPIINEDRVPRKIEHGCAVVWNSFKFKDVKFENVKTKRSSGQWAILETRLTKQKYAFLSIHGKIKDETEVQYRNAAKFIDGLYEDIETIKKSYPTIIPIISGDFNIDLNEEPESKWEMQNIQYIDDEKENEEMRKTIRILNDNDLSRPPNRYLDGNGTNDNISYMDNMWKIGSARRISKYAIRPSSFAGNNVDFVLSNGNLNYKEFRKVHGKVPISNRMEDYNYDKDLLNDFDHFPLEMTISQGDSIDIGTSSSNLSGYALDFEPRSPQKQKQKQKQKQTGPQSPSIGPSRGRQTRPPRRVNPYSNPINSSMGRFTNRGQPYSNPTNPSMASSTNRRPQARSNQDYVMGVSEPRATPNPNPYY